MLSLGAVSYNERGVSYIDRGNGLLWRFQVILQFKFIFSDKISKVIFSASLPSKRTQRIAKKNNKRM